MIKEVSGDILLTKARVIAHGIAPNDHFNTGLAHELREQWPAMYQDFRHYCHAEHPKPGETWVWAGTEGKRIVNMFTQDAPLNHQGNPGRANTHNVNQALRQLRQIIEKEEFESLALPRLATGVGGLDWEEVLPLVKKHLGDLKIPIYLYTNYQKGKPAEE